MLIWKSKMFASQNLGNLANHFTVFKISFTIYKVRNENFFSVFAPWVLVQSVLTIVLGHSTQYNLLM